jgi:TRAP-type C4-dicarboxylate transport system substrate-binding protein
VLAAAATAEARGWEMSEAEATSKTTALSENGITVYAPSAALVEGLEAIGDTMLSNWTENASDSARAILEAYKN